MFDTGLSLYDEIPTYHISCYQPAVLVVHATELLPYGLHVYKFFGLSTSSWINAAGSFGKLLLVWKCVAGLWIAIRRLKPSPQGKLYDITADCHVRHVGTQPSFSKLGAEIFSGLASPILISMWAISYQAIASIENWPCAPSTLQCIFPQFYVCIYMYIILYYIAFFNHTIGATRNESRPPR